MGDYPPVPDGWTLEKPRPKGPFTTAVTYRHPDGRRARWSPRARRKAAPLLGGVARREHTLWAPRRSWWWMAVLFAVGSTCFLLGPIPAFLNLVGPQADAIVFFVGSVFFTVAALLQWLESVHTANLSSATTRHGFARLWNPSQIDWWAGSVQLVGTLFFNATTFRALTTAFGSPSYDRVVWRPDALGSICFLVAGGLGYVEVVGRLARRPPWTLEGVIVAVNLLGCVLFGLSAVGAYVLPTTGNAVNVTIANLTTALGALAFLVGALLLLPERAVALEAQNS